MRWYFYVVAYALKINIIHSFQSVKKNGMNIIKKK